MEAGPSISTGQYPRAIGRTKYGKSCVNCSKAKCKCNFLPGRPACERCDRLNKQCKPLVSVRRGEVQAVEPVSHLSGDDLINDKLDQLISLLQARKGSTTQATETESQVSETVDSGDIPNTSFSLPIHLRLDPTALVELTNDATAETTFSEPAPLSLDNQVKQVRIPKLSISPEQATRCFRRFRTMMLPWLPFMCITESMTLAELERTYPVLHLCILATAATSTSQLYDWTEQFRQTVIKKLHDAGERSLDLIFAILAFIGWLRHYRQERPFFNLWLHMAMTLVSDLGLDKRATGDNMWWPWHRVSVASGQSIVEKRAVLAVFILSSISASSIKTIDSLQWTPHMDNCLQTLEESPEWYGDRVLAVQARCCLITESLNRLAQPTTLPMDLGSGSSSIVVRQEQKSAHITALEMQLTEIKAKVQTYNLEQNMVVAMSIIATNLDIHESIANPETPLDNHGLSVAENLSRYHSQLACLKDWWRLFLSIRPEQFPDVSFSVLTQLIHSIVSLFRLMMLPHPQWDRLLVRNTADVTEYLKTFADVVEESHQQVGLLCDRSDDILMKTVKTMRTLRQYFLNMMATSDLAVNTTEEPATFDFNEPIPDVMDLDFWSGRWLADMIYSWET